ncbi:MAG: FlgO family outer membrane protein [Magnetospirillum sp. WYHS-4]
MFRLRPTGLLAVLLLAAGCAGEPVLTTKERQRLAGDPVILASYAAADQLVQTMQARLDPAQPVLVATLSDINHLEESTPLGRLIAEQIASRIANAGYTVTEIKLRDGFLVREGEGQFVLSRDARRIGQTAGAQAVVAGTYTPARDSIYVNLKILQASDGRVLAAHDYVLPMDDNVRVLAKAAGTRY